MRTLFFPILFIILAVTAPLLTFAETAPAPTAPPAVASPNVHLKFMIVRNGLTVARPQVQVELNHKAIVFQQEARNPYRYKIEVTPSLDPSSAIHLDFRISEVSDEETTLLSTPSVTVFAGDSADVTQKKAHSDELKVTVTPTLQN